MPKKISEKLLTLKELDRKNCGIPAVCENLAQTAAFTSQITTETKRIKRTELNTCWEEAKYLENNMKFARATYGA